MTVGRDGYVHDLFDVCDFWLSGLDLLDRHLPRQDSDLVAPLLGAPMLIDSILQELMRCALTEAEQSAVTALRARLQQRHDVITRTQPTGSDSPVRH